MTIQLHSSPLGPVDERFVDKARAFVDEHVRARAEDWEQNRQHPEAAVRSAISEFAGLRVPRELGGHGASAATVARVYEELAKVDLGFTSSVIVHCNVTIAVSLSQNIPLRDRYLGKLMSGEAVGAFLLTEPGTGSDAAAIQTVARETDGKYVIRGDKDWVVNCPSADLLAVFAQTSPASKAKGIAGFLVEADAPGVDRKPCFNLLGLNATGVGAFSFSDCAVDAGAMAFPPGAAFKGMMHVINVARFGIAAICNGALEAGLNTAVAYAKDRQAFGRPIIDFQGLQWQLAEAVTQLEASRLLTYRTAAMLDNGEDVTVMAAHAKKFATRAASKGLSCAMQVMGANGTLREHALARQSAGARMTHYMDGTTEVQNVVIGRSLVG